MNGPSNYGELEQYILRDLKFYKGNPLKAFIGRYFFEPGFKYVFWLRMTRMYHLMGKRGINFLLFAFSWMKLKKLGHKYSYDISFQAQIGPGFQIAHYGYIIVMSNTTLGDDCVIRPGVVFGKKLVGDSKGAKVGNNVEFGAGSKIIGDLNIGDNVIIGANAVVTKDVPANSIVAGVPAKIIGIRDFGE